ncbi:MAG: hypothetical protein HYS80_00270, partial [Candidatus Aenigmarchaeota archaeon]|nr:hypothetical protein [Candidatus Aenigmarchaeota archaeon]
LAYGLFADYVEVNRTSSIQGQYTGTMVETWRIGFDGKQYLKKLPLLSQAMKLAGEMSDMD